MYLVVPLSLIGIHLVGLPAVGAFVSVHVAAAAPFVGATEEVNRVVLPTVTPPLNVPLPVLSIDATCEALNTKSARVGR